MLTQEENELLTRTGPGTPMGELFRRFWLPAALSEELTPDGPPLRLTILHEDLVAFRDSDGRVGIIDGYCPHRRARLYFGRNEESGLRCIYHGWKFDVLGNCLDTPSEPPEFDLRDKVRMKAYPAREWGDVVWVYMGPRDKMPELPQFEWCRVPASHRTVARWVQECNYFQAMEGEMDPTHGPMLHQWFDGSASRLNGLRPGLSQFNGAGRPSYGFAPRITIKEAAHGLVSGSYVPNAGGEGYRWRLNRWLAPIYSLIAAAAYPVGGRCWVPIDDEHLTAFQYLWNPDRPLTEEERRRLQPNGVEEKEYSPALDRCVYWLPNGYALDTWRDRRNRENDYLQDRELQRTKNFSGVPAQRTQDACVVERQGEGPIADRSREYLGSSDKTIIAMRRKLLQMVWELQDGVEPANACHPEHYVVRALEVVSPHTDLDKVMEEHATDLMVPV